MGIKAHYLQDNDGNKFYPFSHINATYDKNGKIVGERLDEIETDILDKAPLKHMHTPDEVNVIFELESKDKFPLPGIQRALYIDMATDETYRWSESEFKYKRMNSIDSIKNLDGKTVKVILNARNTEEWNQNLSYVPDKGEVCIDTDLNRAKIGDGSTSIDKLEFVWLSAKDIESMTHTHHNDEVLQRITAAFTVEMEEALNDLVQRNPEENVQPDWSETNDNSDAYIKNKPGKISAFTNDKGYITDAELNQTKSYLETNATQKAILAETAAKEFASQLVEKLMGGITDETLDTIEEIASAIKENDNIMKALNEAIGLKADSKTVSKHIDNDNIHVSDVERDRWNQSETNQDAYSFITIDNKNPLLSATHPTDVLNFETVDGIEYVLEQGSGEVNKPYDTIKIKNTRPTYRLYTKSVNDNTIALILEEYYPLTNVIKNYTIPIETIGITNISIDDNGVIIDTPEVVNIRGNAGTATKLQNSRSIVVNIGSKQAFAIFDGSSDISLDIKSINASDIKQNEGEELILSSAL